MLLLLVVGYLTVVTVTLGVAVRSLRGGFPLVMRLLGWLIVAIEAVYMLRSPACVYVPRAAPAAPAIERVLVGKDGSGTLYWLEGHSPIDFAWGPRWWITAGHPIIDGGIEWIPPVRFAVRDETTWEVVSSDGRRRPYPTSKKLYSARGPTWGHSRRALRSDGTLLSWDYDCLRTLSVEKADWECLAPLASSDRVEAATVLGDDHTLEVRL